MQTQTINGTAVDTDTWTLAVKTSSAIKTYHLLPICGTEAAIWETQATALLAKLETAAAKGGHDLTDLLKAAAAVAEPAFQ